MTDIEISELADKYEVQLIQEYDATSALAASEGGLQELRGLVLKGAYDSGVIDGKNADIRKTQEDAVLADDATYQDALDDLLAHKESCNHLKAQRQATEAYIGLMKAWLYSQKQAL